LQLHEAADQVKQSRLAAAGRAKQRKEFTLFDLEGDAVEGKDRPAGGDIVFT
jgi:hypothetical protein